MKLAKHKISLFQSFIWDFYHKQGREFAWRNVENPYHVVVSEIMLQQTQTHRVIQKYDAFIAAFPSFACLADASLRDVLSVWQGLGYNRRGMYLHKVAQKVCTEYNGQLPDSPEVLIMFPGIGKATAASICAFAFNQPTVFIETNIRTVFIHSFFSKKQQVSDADIIPLVEKTVDKENPREWYYALMDYGVMLKKVHPNPSRKSAHYIQQSKFEGSDRQIRGMIIKVLTERESISQEELISELERDSEHVKGIMDRLYSEGLLIKDKEQIRIV